MQAPAKAYLAFVTILGVTLVAASMLLTPAPLVEPVKFLHCAALAAIASTFKVRLPGMPGSISTSFVLFLIAISQLPLPEVLLLTIPAAVVQSLWRTTRRPPAIRIVFNVCATLVNTTIAALFYFAALNKGGIILAIVLASISFFAVGSLLVSGAVSLTKSVPLGQVWRQCDRWALPYYVGGAMLAVLVAVQAQSQGLHRALAMLTALYLLYVWFDVQMAAMKDQRTA
ncbi:MAG TPA: hypothetical protein VEU96_18475 [Bryobacteraceae bacterium]|nr:hypothetical protein [Bryobacteraceae bacterium]